MNRNSVLGTLISILIEILLILVLVFVIWGAGRWAYSFGYAIFAEKTVEEEPGTDIPGDGHGRGIQPADQQDAGGKRAHP